MDVKPLLNILLRPYVLLALLIITLVAAGYSYMLYQKTQADIQIFRDDPQAAARAEASRLKEEVSELMALPEKEEPTVATITDDNKLKDQPFFSKAEKGDKVLVYSEARKAILYRPSVQKVIDVATINPNTLGLTSKVALYNGTSSSNVVSSAKSQLKQLDTVEIVTESNAKRQDYKKTLVIDLTGNRKQAAEDIAKLLKGQVSSLPEGETKPNAHILVILGSE
jgi:hypothetical protein